MPERITKIVSEYTKIPIDQLQSETQIGRSVVGNSIILHRMYAAIAKEGIEIQGYQEIKTFGELVNKVSGNPYPGNSVIPKPKIIPEPSEVSHQKPGVGIDIEEISKMPEAIDFREDEFYKMNFTPGEIAYCILQPNQYASFTGLFAAKEAMVKAENFYKNVPFNTIFIDHLPGGQPFYKGFTMSISHTETLAIAVAVKDSGNTNNSTAGKKEAFIKNDIPSHFWISVIAVLLASIAICISLFKK